jgi:hypothetical protein
VDKQIAAAGVVAKMTPIGVIPTNEAQARELGRVQPERRADVMAAASANGAPTAVPLRRLVLWVPSARG